MTRHAKFLFMKDLLDHLGRCHEQWEATEAPNDRFLADTIRRDLDELRRLCDSLRSEVEAPPALRRKCA